jgi:hypothetical protein
MKSTVRIYLNQRHQKIVWDTNDPNRKADILEWWPDIKCCVELYYKNSPEMKQYQRTVGPAMMFKWTDRFAKSLSKFCVTKNMKLQLIDALTKKVYKVHCGGLRDVPIKERSDLRHFYVSNSWRVFYRKKSGYILLEEFCLHKKGSY